MAYITCSDTAFSYDGVTVCKNINFEVNSGDYLCIVGENGAGKSTLIKGLLGLKAPSAGTIEKSPELGANEVGFLPQQTVVQKDFPASVYEVVLSGCLNQMGFRPFFTRAMKQRALESLDKMGISELKNRCYRELSGGQQQRVLLARALCATQKLLLLDEPVAGLDPMVTLELYQQIQKLNREGITIIMVSHDVFRAVKYAGKILHLAGEQLFYGETSDYVDSPAGKQFLRGESDV